MSIENEFDAFAEGIEPGGLRNSTQIKVLITFVISKITEPLKDETLIEAMQVHGLANYFDVVQAIDELVASGNISYADGYVYITPKGSLSVGELSKELPRTVKETALADTIRLQLLEKREGENTVEIEKKENGYYVTFNVVHNGESLMQLTVYAADFEQAQQLKHNFLKDPSHVYSTVITSLFT